MCTDGQELVSLYLQLLHESHKLEKIKFSRKTIQEGIFFLLWVQVPSWELRAPNMSEEILGSEFMAPEFFLPNVFFRMAFPKVEFLQAFLNYIFKK